MQVKAEVFQHLLLQAWFFLKPAELQALQGLYCFERTALQPIFKNLCGQACLCHHWNRVLMYGCQRRAS